MNFRLLTPKDTVNTQTRENVANFLFDHLDRFGDEYNAIIKCIDFAMDDQEKFGGFILYSYEDDFITGAVVVNKTGMEGYIPENILVYIAVHRDHRGKGLGGDLMKRALDVAKGSVKLHVEPDNPARYLYENLGFKSKYLEMRLNR